MSILTLRSSAVVPAVHKRNFINLYLDILWFGLLSGSAINFMAIFATRQGANSWQIGLLGAAPGIVTLLVALPTGQWLQNHSLTKTTFWAAAGHRIFYVLWIFLPVLFTPARQVQLLIASLFLMSLPGTVLAISFNNLLASSVPSEWRGHVVGMRNAMFAASSIVVSFLCGWLLDNLPFVQGYQIVFGIGAFGALMSTIHLWFIRPEIINEATRYQQPIRDWAHPGSVSASRNIRTAIGLRSVMRGQHLGKLLNREVFNGPYKWVLILLFGFHLAQYVAIPMFPLYTVKTLKLSDQVLSIGNVFFYAALFLGSTQLARISDRFGHKTTLAVGAALMSLYPLLVAGSVTVFLYYLTSVIGGIAWTLAGGAIGNYLLEHVPADNRPPYLAWYNLSLNAAVLLGSLLGPVLADGLGLASALIIAAGLRLLMGIFLWRWG